MMGETTKKGKVKSLYSNHSMLFDSFIVRKDLYELPGHYFAPHHSAGGMGRMEKRIYPGYGEPGCVDREPADRLFLLPVFRRPASGNFSEAGCMDPAARFFAYNHTIPSHPRFY